eukprot:282743-Rhodomonas_salina.1
MTLLSEALAEANKYKAEVPARSIECEQQGSPILALAAQVFPSHAADEAGRQVQELQAELERKKGPASSSRKADASPPPKKQVPILLASSFSPSSSPSCSTINTCIILHPSARAGSSRIRIVWQSGVQREAMSSGVKFIMESWQVKAQERAARARALSLSLTRTLTCRQVKLWRGQGFAELFADVDTDGSSPPPPPPPPPHPVSLSSVPAPDGRSAQPAPEQSKVQSKGEQQLAGSSESS